MLWSCGLLYSMMAWYYQNDRGKPYLDVDVCPLKCNNQTVKEGQVVCYIEQLGSQYPVETEVAGEIIKILREDGDPVGYGDPLIAILPSFPGIKKLQ